MASPTWWTWVWVNSRSWWWTGRPGMLWFIGSQRVGHDWATELNWTVHIPGDQAWFSYKVTLVFCPVQFSGWKTMLFTPGLQILNTSGDSFSSTRYLKEPTYFQLSPWTAILSLAETHQRNYFHLLVFHQINCRGLWRKILPLFLAPAKFARGSVRNQHIALSHQNRNMTWERQLYISI